MAGIAGVVVAPEWRGRGVARLLMTSAMQRALELGDVVSVLFPAVAAPYRRLGWELAGSVTRTTIAAEPLRALAAPAVALRRATAADVDAILALTSRHGSASRASGPLDLSRDDVDELVSDPDNFCYLAPDGFLLYAWDGKELRVERLISESAETTRALWALVGSGASVVRSVYTYLPTHDPIHWFLDASAGPDVRVEPWMLRLLDARQAISGRGYPAGTTADVPITLSDDWLVGCTGSFRLRVGSGSGELVPADDSPGSLRLGPNGLAALYAGTPMYTLRGAGLATGGTPEHDELLDAVFAARPYLIDSF